MLYSAFIHHSDNKHPSYSIPATASKAPAITPRPGTTTSPGAPAVLCDAAAALAELAALLATLLADDTAREAALSVLDLAEPVAVEATLNAEETTEDCGHSQLRHYFGCGSMLEGAYGFSGCGILCCACN